MEFFFQTIVQTEGLVWIIMAAFIAGIVRGFAGFGTAMIFLPVAAVYLGPVQAITALLVMDIIAPLSLVRPMMRDARLGELKKLLIGMAIVVPIASFILTSLSPEMFRYIVSIVALVLLCLLILGVRYKGVLKDWMLYATGALGGFLGGVSGVPGPPVIMIYMASDSPPHVIRANNFLYLFVFDCLAILIFLLRGLIGWAAIFLGLVLAIPYFLGIMLGQLVFDPGKEKLYRIVAYLIIGISALRGLPIWG